MYPCIQLKLEFVQTRAVQAAARDPVLISERLLPSLSFNHSSLSFTHPCIGDRMPLRKLTLSTYLSNAYPPHFPLSSPTEHTHFSAACNSVFAPSERREASCYIDLQNFSGLNDFNDIGSMNSSQLQKLTRIHVTLLLIPQQVLN